MTRLMAVPEMRGAITDARPTEVGKIGPMPNPVATRAHRTRPGSAVVKAARSDAAVIADPAASSQRLLTRKTPSRTLDTSRPVSYTHLRAHETRHDLVCRLLLEK